MKKYIPLKNWRPVLIAASILSVALLAFTIPSHKKEAKTVKAKTVQAGVDFRIAVLPDIQFYTGMAHGGKPAMFTSQINWIKQHQADSNIVYVAGLGDTVDDTVIDSVPPPQQWVNASLGYYALEVAPALAYGVTVGNHDEADTTFPQKEPGKYHNHPGLSPVRNTTENYNKYFGADHFKNKPWYGGHANILGKNNNDLHYDKFTVGGKKYMVIFIPFDVNGQNGEGEDKDGLMMKWVHGVLEEHRDTKAIIVSHSILKGPKDGNFSEQGKRIYDGVKDMPNVFLMLCGHVTGEYMREDVYQGNTIKTYLIDCQALPNGGGGRMRTMRINSATNAISINTFSPYKGE
ncbi:MAG: hypothetical protein V4592_11870 [Bacteroidota bacterium]